MPPKKAGAPDEEKKPVAKKARTDDLTTRTSDSRLSQYHLETINRAVETVVESFPEAFRNNVNGILGGPVASTSSGAAAALKQSLVRSAEFQLLDLDSSDDEAISSKREIEYIFRKFNEASQPTKQGVQAVQKKKDFIVGKSNGAKNEITIQIQQMQRLMTPEELRNCPTPVLEIEMMEEGVDSSSTIPGVGDTAVEEIQGDTNEVSGPSGSRTRSIPRKGCPPINGKKTTVPVTEITISDSDDDKPTCSKRVSAIKRGKKKSKGKSTKPSSKSLVLSGKNEEEQEEEVDLGALLLFNIECRGDTWPVRLYEKQFVRELRSLIAKKLDVCSSEIPLLFLGTHNRLEDDKTLGECGISNLCTIEAYMNAKTDKELYDEGSSNVLKLKLQTSDRRGRQDKWVYMRMNKTFETTVEEYAVEIGIPSTGIRIKFEGELLNLKSTPADYDLEGEECLDLILPN